MPYAIITGATQGIGKAIAEKLLSEGFSVAICARNKSEVEQTREIWQKQYPDSKILAVQADLGDREQVLQFGIAVLTEFEEVDILVNNAGIFIPGTLAEEPEGNLEALMSVNLYSAYHLTRILLPAMKKRQSGHIFNICSVASLKAYPNGGAYSVTKYALLGFSENLRHELIPFSIKVTALCPGATNSRSWAGADLPEGRIMESTDIANILWAAYSLSSQADVETIVIRPLKGDL